MLKLCHVISQVSKGSKLPSWKSSPLEILLEKGKQLITSMFSLSHFLYFINPLSQGKLLDLRALADNKMNVTENFELVLGIVENIMGEGENAGYQHFLFFPH